MQFPPARVEWAVAMSSPLGCVCGVGGKGAAGRRDPGPVPARFAAAGFTEGARAAVPPPLAHSGGQKGWEERRDLLRLSSLISLQHGQHLTIPTAPSQAGRGQRPSARAGGGCQSFSVEDGVIRRRPARVDDRPPSTKEVGRGHRRLYISPLIAPAHALTALSARPLPLSSDPGLEQRALVPTAPEPSPRGGWLLGVDPDVHGGLTPPAAVGCGGWVSPDDPCGQAAALGPAPAGQRPRQPDRVSGPPTPTRTHARTHRRDRARKSNTRSLDRAMLIPATAPFPLCRHKSTLLLGTGVTTERFTTPRGRRA